MITLHLWICAESYRLAEELALHRFPALPVEAAVGEVVARALVEKLESWRPVATLKDWPRWSELGNRWAAEIEDAAKAERLDRWPFPNVSVTLSSQEIDDLISIVGYALEGGSESFDQLADSSVYSMTCRLHEPPPGKVIAGPWGRSSAAN